jgi:tRNA-binding protein
MHSESSSIINFSDFLEVEMRVGTIVTCELNTKAHKPAYILSIDFGEFGIKTSSAQITQNYTVKDLIGTQIVAVMNFEPKRVAGVQSQVLVLASVSDSAGTVLLSPNLLSPNGSLIS